MIFLPLEGKMDLRLTFNEDAARYDRWRPTYVPELYGDIFNFSGIGADSRVLEIGIGTGQATLPVLKTGCRVTAVELGAELAEFSREKFSEYPDFEIKNVSFEEYACRGNTFDLIYSATAFHWIPEELGYKKVYDLLKGGGTFARFANRPHKDKSNEPLHQTMQKMYAKYMDSDEIGREFDEEQCVELADIPKKYGFTDIEYKLYHRIRTFDAEGYVSLLRTYSDHIAMGEEKLAPFEAGIKEAINSHGGKMNIYDTIDLQLARKP